MRCVQVLAMASMVVLAPVCARAESATGAADAVLPDPALPDPALGEPIPAPPTAFPPASLLDAVRLVGGGLYLGTILAFVPGEFVLIRSYGGAEHCIAWGDVAYAGPAAHELSVRLTTPLPLSPFARVASMRNAAHASTSSQCTSHTERPPSEAEPAPPRTDPSLARVEIDGDDGAYTIHLHTGTKRTWSRRGPGRRVPKFTRVCTTPCVAFLPPGRQPLAVSVRKRKPVIVRGGVEVRDGSRLVVAYESRRTQRIAGALTLAVSLLTGLGMIMGVEIAGDACSAACNPTDRRLVISGGVLLGVGLAIGIPLVTRRDVARIRSLQPARQGR